MPRPIDADALPRVTECCVDEAGFFAKFNVVHEEDIKKAPILSHKDLVPQWEHTEELLKAEAEKRLVVLPCKVGSTLYRIQHEYKTGNPFIRAVTFNRNNFWRIVFGGEFGKTVFLTREEAEAALK